MMMKMTIVTSSNQKKKIYNESSGRESGAIEMQTQTSTNGEESKSGWKKALESLVQ